MLSYMKVMHYGLMFPKARHGDAALIWNALCGKWIYRSAVKKSGLGADNHFWFDLVRSSKPLPGWMFRTSEQQRWDRRCLKILPKKQKISKRSNRRNQKIRLSHSDHYNDGCCTWLYCTSTHRSTQEDTFLIVPLWPGNYPNLPSSWAPAPALRPPLQLHYQRWSSLMAWWLHHAGRLAETGWEEDWQKKRGRRRRRRSANSNH